ncbi:unnamed protein product [Heligmosomoides polygyrus]|uniref:MFS domain-containing protein n=1 Tax=Heligmosomoides polygyrus TaxID=6339 RepID=A0A3P8CQ27_HELPZ|nr:unnamed protein product [Heligmosomoides polygyrus]
MTSEKQYNTVPLDEGKDDLPSSGVIPMKNVDDFLKMGNYCYLILIIAEFFLLAGAGNMIFMVFAGSAPKVSCVGSNFTIVDVCKAHLDPTKLTDCDLEVNYEFKSLNVEVSLFPTYLKATLYENLYASLKSKPLKCSLQFGYLCAEGRWVKSSISVQMVGVLLGTLFFGTMSDRYGRKSSLFVSFIMTSIFSIASSFSNSLVTFTVLRTILGFFSGGLLGTYGVYKMEHIPKKHRFWVATVIAWAPNFILLNLVAYISHDWRTFQRVLVVISSPALLLFFVVHESPRWLIQKGKIKEARHVLQRIQHIDGQKEAKRDEMEKMLDVAYQKLQAREEKMKNYNMRHLFYNREMSLATGVFCLGVFMTSMINYGLVFNIETLSGSFFINSVLMGAIRWGINIVFGVLDYRWKPVGRKAVHMISQASIATALAAIAALYVLKIETSYSGVVRVATIFAAATTSQIFITKTISAMEYYPTVVRNSGLAFKSTCSRFGTILAPQLFIVVLGDGGIVHTQVVRMFTNSPPWVRFHQLSQSVVVDIGFTP